MPDKQKRYGETFLTKHRWETRSRRRAKRSPFQWAGHADCPPWRLSLLGVINGPLSWVDLVITVHVNNDGTIESYTMKRRRW